MKKALTFILSAVLALSATGYECAAQNYVAPPVTISTTKVEKDGKLYYEHKVLEKQTLYSISKTYDVYIDEIYAANPGLKENGLKKGTVIYIPVNGDTSVSSGGSGDSGGSSSSGGSANGSDENTANSASLTAENSENNPVSEENSSNSGKNTAKSASFDGGGKASSSVSSSSSKAEKSSSKQTDFEKRSAEKKAARKAEKDKRKNFTTHVVKWYETLGDISEKYGVPVAVIMDVNGLTSEEVTARQKLLIPNNPEDYVVETPEPEVTETVAEAPAPETDSTATDADATAKLRKNRPDFLGKNDVCATLLLPFNAKTGGGNELSMDFYSGALLAAKHLSEDSGISLYINAFDCYGDALPDASDLSYSDFVVGLLSKDGFSELMEYVPKDCRVVSPLDMNTLPLAEDHADFYQCSNSTTAQYADIAQWLVEDMEEGDRILIIHEKSLVGTDQAKEVEDALGRYGFSWETFSYSILDGRNITESLGKLMVGWNPEEKEVKEVKKGVNRVIIATSNEAFANDALRNLNVLLHNDLNIVLYGGSKIRGFENVPVENLHNVNFHSSLSFYIDYDDPKVQKFLMEYRALYNTEPSQTAFQGYDIMYYFTIMNRRVSAMHLVERPKDMPMLMSDFKFEKCGSNGGQIRTGIRRTVYEPDYSITYLK